MDLENAITSNDILQCRKAVELLKRNLVISKEQEVKILKSIQIRENQDMWFVTKPFKYNEGQSKTAYEFMKHMIHKLRILEMPNEDKSI